MPPKTAKGVPFQLSAEQLALQAARRALKEKTGAQSTQADTAQANQSKILKREWLESGISENEKDRLSIMTWNMLAQSLIRRDLFPNSDALKFSERAPMLSSEILAYNADILCLQEVDKLDTLLPAIEHLYGHIYTSGHGKKHGCMILFKKELFELHFHKTVYYDDEEVRHGSLEGDEENSSTWRRGASRATKNIGLIVAFKRKENTQEGFVIATTHLFWHPAFVYERTKQVGLLLRAVSTFRQQNSLGNWPCFIAGDFNLTPDDIAYSLMVGETITASQRHAFEYSRVIHISVDPTTPKNYEPKPISEEEAEAQVDRTEEKDPDRVIMNSRPCVLSDGLLDFEKLKLLYEESRITPLRSMYDEFLEMSLGNSIGTIKMRTPHLQGRKGGNEPMFTSYTHFWKNTIDYIFLLSPEGCRAEVRGILPPPTAEDLGTGLPRKDICGSDHISLAVKMVFSKNEGKQE